jgi:DNA-binding IclR family transcriptional regulator
MSGGNALAGRSVTSKVASILDAFRASDQHLSLAEISQRTGMPLSTTHRLANELVLWGGLERASRGTYRVGMRLWEIGSLAPQRSGLRDIAIPFMEDLYEATHENVQLAVLAGTDALFVEKINGRHSVQIVTRVGGRLPLHATGVGKALLAFAPKVVQEAVLAGSLRALTPATITDPRVLRDALTEARRLGYAWTRDEMTIGATSVAAPVFGADGEAVASLSLVVATQGADIGRLALPLRIAALGLSRRVAETWDGLLPLTG